MEFCQKCGAKTNGNTYCEQCSCELFTMSDTAQKLLSEDGMPSAKDQKNIAIKKRYCITCGREAKIGSRYCKKHYDEMRQNARIDTHKVFDTIIKDTSNYEVRAQKPVTKKYDGYNAGDFERWNNVSNFQVENKKDTIRGFYSKKNTFHKNIKIVSKNGTVTKSKSECLICDFLTDNHIKFEYEKPLYYSQVSKPLKPDFYIKGPAFFKGRIINNVYIEHFGGLNFSDPEERKRYLDTIEFKIPKYKRAGITLICTYEEDMYDYTRSLTAKLKDYKKNTINYLKES